MPIYTYKCNTCGLKEDFMKSMGDFKVQLCPKCSYDPNIQGDDEKMTRIFINVGKPQFKGSGFYETDYKGK